MSQFSAFNAKFCSYFPLEREKPNNQTGVNLGCRVRVSPAFIGDTVNVHCWCSLLCESNCVDKVGVHCERMLQE